MNAKRQELLNAFADEDIDLYDVVKRFADYDANERVLTCIHEVIATMSDDMLLTAFKDLLAGEQD